MHLPGRAEPIRGKAAHARLVRWRGMAICRIAGGVTHEWREYWDPAALAM